LGLRKEKADDRLLFTLPVTYTCEPKGYWARAPIRARRPRGEEP